ncbi:hypothetical protein BGX28_009940 [Mortierella sp. GBA30]|nr:hypothetical protein BGX28_009940 [Mortierella sp. GBA30]
MLALTLSTPPTLSKSAAKRTSLLSALRDMKSITIATILVIAMVAIQAAPVLDRRHGDGGAVNAIIKNIKATVKAPIDNNIENVEVLKRGDHGSLVNAVVKNIKALVKVPINNNIEDVNVLSG